jgi:hypothetical protein
MASKCKPAVKKYFYFFIVAITLDSCFYNRGGNYIKDRNGGKKMKKWISKGVFFLTALAMLAVPALAEESETLLPRIRNEEPGFADTQGVWCEENVKLCWQTGLLAGTSETTFQPSSPLSTAQVIVIAARLQDLLSGGTGVFREPAADEAWYEPALEHYEKAIETANVTLVPTLSETKKMLSYTARDPAPRRWFVQLMYGALEASGTELPAINEPVKIPDSDEHAVHLFYRTGVLNGTDSYGCFKGKDALNRGQAAAILARILDPAQRLSFSQKDFQEFDLCRDVLQLDPDMVLFTIDGKDYTVLQYAKEIVTAADSVNHPMHRDPDPPALLRNPEGFCDYILAPMTLAESVGVSLTETEEAALLQTAPEKEGYQGLPASYWVWRNRSELLEDKLDTYYKEQYGDKWDTEEFYLNGFLYDEGDRLYKTLSRSSNIDKVDLTGIEQRIHQYPKSIFS